VPLAKLPGGCAVPEEGLRDGGPTMPREIARQSKAAPATSLLALAVGAVAFGAVAIGALAIGRLTVGRLTIRKARFNVLEVDQLTVRRLRVLEETTSDHAG
jgi:hypothetical protein